MSQKLKAIYHNGTFIPQVLCDLPENSEVDLIIEGPYIFSPKVTDQNKRKHILDMVIERMLQNPIPAVASSLTRDELHDRCFSNGGY